MIDITEKDFSVDQIISRMKGPEVGALVIFLGIVRGLSQGEKIKEMTVEAYEEMARKKMTELEKIAIGRFGVTDISIIHRKGRLNPSENIVLVAASATHRRQAFEACSWLIDELKKTVPFWKKEYTSLGSRWVEDEGGE